MPGPSPGPSPDLRGAAALTDSAARAVPAELSPVCFRSPSGAPGGGGSLSAAIVRNGSKGFGILAHSSRPGGSASLRAHPLMMAACFAAHRPRSAARTARRFSCEGSGLRQFYSNRRKHITLSPVADSTSTYDATATTIRRRARYAHHLRRRARYNSATRLASFVSAANRS